MASFEIEITRTAEKQLRRNSKSQLARVVDAIRALAEDPLPRGTRRLVGHDDVYRIRVGRYRVVYSVAARRLVVLILKVGHRKDVHG